MDPLNTRPLEVSGFHDVRDFLKDHRIAILILAEKKSAQSSESRPHPGLLRKGLPILYDHFRGEVDGSPADLDGARLAPLRRIGYTIGHVVHAYGVISQAIAELATTKRLAISADEFRGLRERLDLSLAEASREFRSLDSVRRESTKDFAVIQKLSWKQIEELLDRSELPGGKSTPA